MRDNNLLKWERNTNKKTPLRGSFSAPPFPNLREKMDKLRAVIFGAALCCFIIGIVNLCWRCGQEDDKIGQQSQRSQQAIEQMRAKDTGYTYQDWPNGFLNPPYETKNND